MCLPPWMGFDSTTGKCSPVVLVAGMKFHPPAIDSVFPVKNRPASKCQVCRRLLTGFLTKLISTGLVGLPAGYTCCEMVCGLSGCFRKMSVEAGDVHGAEVRRRRVRLVSPGCPAGLACEDKSRHDALVITINDKFVAM
jgi:hypothetical protein